MKKTISFALCALLLCMFMDADAKVRRVGFSGNLIVNQDYTSLQSAHDASNAGDTLLIFPGSWSANFSKKLIVIGYGYFLKDSGANVNVQVINKSLYVSIDLNSTAKGCVLEGLDNLTVTLQNITIDSIKVKRCKIAFELFNPVLTNWEITQSYIIRVSKSDVYYHYPVFKNLLIQNCFIAQFGTPNFQSSTIHTGTFNNNVFGTGTMNFLNGDFLIRNNIFLGTNALVATGNLEYKNNIATNNIIPAGNGNKPNVDITKVCIGYPVAGKYSFDERFKIKSTGPAAGAGENGEDCGMFGGPDLYKLSGIPPIPAFYKLTAPSSMPDSNPYTITFSVRAND